MYKVCNFWRLVIGLGVSKSGLWYSKDHRRCEKIYIVSMHIVQRGTHSGFCVIIGPISVIIGLVN